LGPEDPFAADTASNLFYLLLGVLLSWSGYMWNPLVRHNWTTLVGGVLLGLGLAGFGVSARAAPNLWVTNLEVGQNIFHLVLGVVLVLGGQKLLTEEAGVVPRRYRYLMHTRAVKK
jgi:hypothetical protein